MTEEEKQRLMRLEFKFQSHQEDMVELKGDVKEIKSAVSGLLAAANMGRGAWWMLIKVGAVLVAIAGVVGWVYDRFIGGVGPHP
jgi:hypothetical protein